MYVKSRCKNSSLSSIAVQRGPLFFFNDTATTEIYTLSLHDALPIYFTAVDANSRNTRILAGGLNNPSVYDRFAEGVAVTQLITDFGRTGSVASSAKYQARAAIEGQAATREQVLLNVEANYFAVLKAQSVAE